jgi:phenylalanyl-tRNA synthetase beta chain
MAKRPQINMYLRLVAALLSSSYTSFLSLRFMLISIHWLKEFLDVNASANEIADKLSVSGLEVEHLHHWESIPGGLRGFVIAEVVECSKHPNADKLSVTRVNVGEQELYPIVCGAPNVAAGQKVIVALPGTEVTVPGKGTFTISEAKIRGEISRGMICAEDECGLGSSHDGILVLPADAPVGMPAATYFEVVGDEVLEIGLTANRGDAASHLGVARDVAALFGSKVRLPQEAQAPANPSGFSIALSDTNGCRRYAAVLVEGVTPGPSPAWMQNRLKSIGLEPINNIVDCTNFVLHELGQPTHAFDADLLSGKCIEVRKARKNEKLTTLDKTDRNLNETDLVVCDGEKPVALAGVFGGVASSVSATTRNVLIESAHFHPGMVRKTAKAHGLSTDASFRFERGTDIEMCVLAACRVADLIVATAGGKVVGCTDIYLEKQAPTVIEFSPVALSHFAGDPGITAHESAEILNALGFVCEPASDGVYNVQVPSWRNDVQLPEDLYEEVLRIRGYDLIPMDGKMQVSLGSFEGMADRRMLNNIRRCLEHNGYTEMMSNSLGNAAWFAADEKNWVVLNNPLSADMAVMRTRLLPGMLQSAAYNRNRRVNDIRLFETGRTYRKTDKGFEETEMLGILLSGNKTAESWEYKPSKVGFYDLKEIAQVVNATAGNLHGIEAWKLGAVASDDLKLFELEGEFWYAEVALDDLRKSKRPEGFAVKEVPRFPFMRRDLSLVIDKQVEYAELEKVVWEQKIDILQQIRVFDVFEGKPLDEGKKAIAMGFYLGREDRTLTDVEADEVQTRLMTAFEKIGALIRK